jgi:hypothetical protein
VKGSFEGRIAMRVGYAASFRHRRSSASGVTIAAISVSADRAAVLATSARCRRCASIQFLHSTGADQDTLRVASDRQPNRFAPAKPNHG